MVDFVGVLVVGVCGVDEGDVFVECGVYGV